MNELQEKVARLPAWAREYIKALELKPEALVNEAVKLRRDNAVLTERAKRLSESNEALMEILRYAGKAGMAHRVSDWAATVVATLEGYEIFREVTSEQP